MRSAILAVALMATVGAAAMAESGNKQRGQGRFPIIVQGLEGVTTGLPRAAGELHLGVQNPGATPASFSVSRKRFTCAQIRVMDEVELITDDSYCD